MENPQPTKTPGWFTWKWMTHRLLVSIAGVRGVAAQFLGAIAFYTIVPIPSRWSLEFKPVSRWVVLVGLLIGSLLGLLDFGLANVGMPSLSRSAVLVGAWVWLTGGLHMDGAMDTADGLAVPDPSRRLQVMTDSATGAFGAIAGILLLLLKTAALTDLEDMRWLALILAAGWGRWGQQVAIARYPYLKPTGKGAFHQAALPSMGHCLPSLGLLLGLSVLPIGLTGDWQLVAMACSGGAIAFLAAAWFNRQLGGHTGDTYGAVVEWTEAIFLILLTPLL
jgi:adenosylcobinamide-GDP ribazoletransferase